MNANGSFTIGSTHAVCQDYVVATEGPQVFLSDGCSSSPDTDIGARLLVKAAQRIFSNVSASEIEELHRESAKVALRWTRRLGIRAEAVDATLMSAHVCGDELIVGCSGDGVVLLETRGGDLEVHAISCPSGYPFYPAYTHQPERLASLIDNGRSEREVKHFRREGEAGELKLIGSTGSDSLTAVFNLKTGDYKYVALASDGIHSFFKTERATNGKRVENISLAEVLHELWSFKNSHGAFVERRLKRFHKDCEARYWHHGDDLSLGVIHLD